MKFCDMPYERIDFQKIEGQFQAVMREFAEAKSGAEQFEIHQKFYQLQDCFITMSTIAQIRHDIDTADEYYDKESEYYDEIMPKYDKLVVEYKKLLYNSKFRSFLEEKIGLVAFKNIELSMKAFDEKLIPFMQRENALTSKYDKLIASAKIEWNGDILNISLLRPYLMDKDREIRKMAWKKLDEFFYNNQQELDTIYDELIKNRTEQANICGYENYIKLGYYKMNRNCYDKEMVENFRKQVKQYLVPLAEKIHEQRRINLGIDKLRYYDEGICFVNGNPNPKGTPEEILNAGKRMYGELSVDTKEFFDFMMTNELFDVMGRKTKKAGGYMTYLPEYKSPFIFANFNGTSGDVDVITHECGHAFQGYVSGKDPIREHADITMETAEIHSMAMEFFAEKWMPLFFGERADDYIKMHLEDAVTFIPYGCMVDEFQHIVYENPKMTPTERKEVWKKLEREYKPHLDYEESQFFINGGYWQKQLHIYDYPFYYIDYCLAQTCALQYKMMMDENFDEAWKSYLKLCKLSAGDFFTGLLKSVGLMSPFEDGCLEKIVNSYQ